MDTIFTRLFSLTLAGSLTYLLLLAAESLLPRAFTYRWRFYARAAVLAAFTVPLTVPEPFLRPPPVGAADFPAMPAQVLQEISGSLAFSAPPPTFLLTHLLPALWACGAALFLLWRLFAWLRFSAAVHRLCRPVEEAEETALTQCKHALGLRRRVSLRVCPGLGAPALVGILRPVILLPRLGIPSGELACILRHELIHLRRADIPFKLAAQAVNAAHWFNPFAWLLTRQIGELCELSCDEAATYGLTHEERRRYGLAILNQIESARRGVPSSVTAFAGTKQIIMKRLDIIMKLPEINKKRTALAVIGAFVLCAAGATAVLALAPAGDSNAAQAPNAFAITQPNEAGTEVAQVSLSGPIPNTADFRYVSLSFGDMDHMGTDIVAPEGSDILAAAGGVVVYTQMGEDSPYGNHVILDHGNNYKTLYAHCDKLLVKQGDTVQQGQAIATVGATGYATGPHCHFEVRKGADPVDAEEYLEISNIAPNR